MVPQTLEVESGGRRVTYVLRPELGEPGRPVYEIDRSGVLAYPSGSVWVRFRAGDSPSQHVAQLEAAGYRIDSIPGYAPHAAFVRADDIATALANLEALRTIDGVEAVEPQLLMDRALR